MPHRLALWAPKPGADPHKLRPGRTPVGVDWLGSIRAGKRVGTLEGIPTARFLARVQDEFPDAVSAEPQGQDWSDEAGAWTAHGYLQGIEVVLWDEVPDEVLNRLLAISEEFGLQPFSYPR